MCSLLGTMPHSNFTSESCSFLLSYFHPTDCNNTNKLSHACMYRIREIPAKEIECITIGFSHLPDFLEGKLIRYCASIFAECVLKLGWNIPANNVEQYNVCDGMMLDQALYARNQYLWCFWC